MQSTEILEINKLILLSSLLEKTLKKGSPFLGNLVIWREKIKKYTRKSVYWSEILPSLAGKNTFSRHGCHPWLCATDNGNFQEILNTLSQIMYFLIDFIDYIIQEVITATNTLPLFRWFHFISYLFRIRFHISWYNQLIRHHESLLVWLFQDFLYLLIISFQISYRGHSQKCQICMGEGHVCLNLNFQQNFL